MAVKSVATSGFSKNNIGRDTITEIEDSLDVNGEVEKLENPLSVCTTITSEGSPFHSELDFDDFSDGELDYISDAEVKFADDTKPSLVNMKMNSVINLNNSNSTMCIVDQIKAIEQNLEDFQERLMQYDHDINSIESAARTLRSSDPKSLDMDSDCDSNKWLDNGHGLLPFIRSCLRDPLQRHIIYWVEENKEFEIIDLSKLAEMWGREKKKDDMTKRKLNRSLSYLVKQKHKLIRSSVKKSIYKIVTPDKKQTRNQERRYSNSSNDSSRLDVPEVSKPKLNANKLEEFGKQCAAKPKPYEEETNIQKHSFLKKRFSSAENLLPAVLGNTSKSLTTKNEQRKRAHQSLPGSPMSGCGLSSLNLSKSNPMSLIDLPETSRLTETVTEPPKKVSKYNLFLEALNKEAQKRSSVPKNLPFKETNKMIDIFSMSSCKNGKHTTQQISNHFNGNTMLVQNSSYESAAAHWIHNILTTRTTTVSRFHDNATFGSCDGSSGSDSTFHDDLQSINPGVFNLDDGKIKKYNNLSDCKGDVDIQILETYLKNV